MASYFDNIVVELNAIIISKLIIPKDIVSFKKFLGEVSYSSNFINSWKLVSGSNYYNPAEMMITQHPLIRNLHEEFKKLRLRPNPRVMGDFPDPNNIIVRKVESSKWVLISEIEPEGEYVRIKIDAENFDIYSKSGGMPRGNLGDIPYHGFDLINGKGVIINNSKRKTRLKELGDKK